MSYYFEVAGSMFVAALRRSLSESSSLYNSSLPTLDGLLTGGGDLFTGFLITHDSTRGLGCMSLSVRIVCERCLDIQTWEHMELEVLHVVITETFFFKVGIFAKYWNQALHQWISTLW